MGWGSATPIFDTAVDVALEFLPTSGLATKPQVLIKAIVEKMYKELPLDDWDTQDESNYYDEYLIHVMYDMGEVDENHYQYHLAGKPDDWDWSNKGW